MRRAFNMSLHLPSHVPCFNIDSESAPDCLLALQNSTNQLRSRSICTVLPCREKKEMESSRIILRACTIRPLPAEHVVDGKIRIRFAIAVEPCGKGRQLWGICR